MKDKRKRRKSFDFCLELYRVGERFTFPAFSHVVWLRYNYFENFTMQSIQMGLSVIVSINTLAGCISSNKRRSEI